jgi:hypothetical protein
VEPGLLKVFRWFAVGRLSLLLLAAVSNLLPAESRVLRFPIFGIVEFVLVPVL